jgi:hypothetical protein
VADVDPRSGELPAAQAVLAQKLGAKGANAENIGDGGNIWAEIEGAFLNTYQARWQCFADEIGLGFAQGKQRTLRRFSMSECSSSVASIKIPYYNVINGRGYWRPSKKLRALGFQDVRCGPDGPAAWAIADTWNKRTQATLQGEQAAPIEGNKASNEPSPGRRRTRSQRRSSRSVMHRGRQ